jgi:iron complex outermembrane receptor protein
MNIVTQCFARLRRCCRTERIVPVFIILFSVIAEKAPAADATRKSFTIPSGDAIATLRQFVAQSGRELIYSGMAVEGVQTNAVQGEFTAREALNRMLAGTSLCATEDRKTGALAVVRRSDENRPPGGAARDSCRHFQTQRPSLR